MLEISNIDSSSIDSSSVGNIVANKMEFIAIRTPSSEAYQIHAKQRFSSTHFAKENCLWSLENA